MAKLELTRAEARQKAVEEIDRLAATWPDEPGADVHAAIQPVIALIFDPDPKQAARIKEAMILVLELAGFSDEEKIRAGIPVMCVICREMIDPEWDHSWDAWVVLSGGVVVHDRCSAADPRW